MDGQEITPEQTNPQPTAEEQINALQERINAMAEENKNLVSQSKELANSVKEASQRLEKLEESYKDSFNSDHEVKDTKVDIEKPKTVLDLLLNA